MTNAQLGSWFSALTPSAPADAIGDHLHREGVVRPSSISSGWPSPPTPRARVAAGEPFAITPSTAQAPYCLTRLLALRASLTQRRVTPHCPPGLDWCSTSVERARSPRRAIPARSRSRSCSGPTRVGCSGSRPRPERRRGTPTIESLKSLDQAFSSTVVVVAPVYGGATPTTAAGRASCARGMGRRHLRHRHDPHRRSGGRTATCR